MVAVVIASVLCSCGTKTPAAVEERERWLESLNDSIALYQDLQQKGFASLDEQRHSVGALVAQFDYVNNPREVEGYYILRGWKSRYPLSATGVVARVTEYREFELIAALTGAHFNEIAAVSGGVTVASAVVPHDQAVNYRAGNLNRVSFSGEKADSIGAFIAAHSSDGVEIVFLEGKRTGSYRLPADSREMIAKTWRLCEEQKRLYDMEREQKILSGKIAACRRMLDSASTEEDAEENNED